MSETPSRKIWKGFKEHFGLDNIFIHETLTQSKGKYEFDIFEFENWLVIKGFNKDSNMSIAEFIEKRYGRQAMLFIASIL